MARLSRAFHYSPCRSYVSSLSTITTVSNINDHQKGKTNNNGLEQNKRESRVYGPHFFTA